MGVYEISCPFMAFMRNILKIRILPDFLYLPIPFMPSLIDAKFTHFLGSYITIPLAPSLIDTRKNSNFRPMSKYISQRSPEGVHPKDEFFNTCIHVAKSSYLSRFQHLPPRSPEGDSPLRLASHYFLLRLTTISKPSVNRPEIRSIRYAS
jgi:hypothetical protein